MPDTSIELCARCGRESSPPIPAVCPHCEGPPRLAGRYALLEVLGRSAERTTYRARRLEDGVEVAIKEMLFRRMESWKSEELFAREIRTLRELDHPSVPRLLDTLEIDDGPRSGLYLVRELVTGRSLEAEMRARSHTSREVAVIAAELLDVAADLHALSPPIVHRDLTLSNVLRRSDGRLVLVDLGAVKDTIASASGGSTLVGTYGYVAPEQLRGAASPASDVYGVGAIALALLARRPAHELLDARHRFPVQAYAHRGMRALLERMLAPEPRARPSASDAARAMRDLALGREPLGRAPLAIGLTAMLLVVGVSWASVSSGPPMVRAASHEPVSTVPSPPAPPAFPTAFVVPPAPDHVLPPLPDRDLPDPIDLTDWTPACDERHACVSVSSSFAGISLTGECAPLLPAGEAPAQSRARDAVERTFAGMRFSCDSSQQLGSFCNVVCTTTSADGWGDADALARWIGDRHGLPSRADEATTASGLGSTTRTRSWSFRAEDASAFGPEVLVLAARTFAGGLGDEVRGLETVTISYRGPFSREVAP